MKTAFCYNESMKRNDYQEKFVKFDLNGERRNIDYVSFAFLDNVLDLSGETGEVPDKVKKMMRDANGKISVMDKLTEIRQSSSTWQNFGKWR